MNNIFAVCTFVSIEAKTNTEDGWISKNIQRNLQIGVAHRYAIFLCSLDVEI